MPLISVILPVYNGEKTVRETIDSVLTQTFYDLELLVIDDGSIDGTQEILDGVSDPRFQFFSYTNGGLAASRNRGIDRASGKYFAFIDADDLWTETKLEEQLAALQSYPRAAVAYSWTNAIDEWGNVLRPGSHKTYNGNILDRLLLCNVLENGSNPLIRRDAIENVGKYDESLPAAQDWDFYLRLAEKYKFVCVPQAQILYRLSFNSMSTDLSRLEAASVAVVSRAFDNAPASLQYLKPHSMANLYKYYTHRSLEYPRRRRQGLAAIRFFAQLLRHDPGFVRQKRTAITVVLKSFALVLLPLKLAKRAFEKLDRISPPYSLLVDIRLDPPSS
ncbi:glycosyltransferase [Oscillatoriales cyanobacterium LEGE 11467]|uniref:Glycosyltransferase n=1 Tax=Zarconia navalis LEGE 11467 TaxID=1828826 RepID=A0A928VT66_9CYAN|nr:glycosyltransferase [Zarconia navalis]MBE9039696.1 glycosyltransferase [Zarconia navalis LEGE 11467]